MAVAPGALGYSDIYRRYYLPDVCAITGRGLRTEILDIWGRTADDQYRSRFALYCHPISTSRCCYWCFEPKSVE